VSFETPVQLTVHSFIAHFFFRSHTPIPVMTLTHVYLRSYLT